MVSCGHSDRGRWGWAAHLEQPFGLLVGPDCPSGRQCWPSGQARVQEGGLASPGGRCRT